ncbi:MAG: histidine kinase [Propionibacteriaceae bacterium]|nr:histidine kinase [Propionibacteriaceae bacterium]
MRPLLPLIRLESSPARLPAPDSADWALAALVAIGCVAEVVLRDDLPQWPVALGMGLLLASTMLRRRTHPLAMVLIAFGALAAVDVVSMMIVGEPFFLYVGFFVLVLVFSLLRWAGRRHAMIGMGVVLLVWAVSTISEATGVEDAVGGVLVLLLTAALGLIVRYRAIVVAQHLENVRATERESLARELHDTVAHRVSAITIQAQAGRWLASTRDLDGAAEALRIIEVEASLALTEMRAVVGALRRDDSTTALLIPRGLAGIEALATCGGPSSGPAIEVERQGNLNGLTASVEATLYRVAQESVTNIRSHALRPTIIKILLEGHRNDVLVSVTDDGEHVAPAGNRAGYGLVGMAERVALLGGTLHAGPGPDRGWCVEARIPRTGGTT